MLVDDRIGDDYRVSRVEGSAFFGNGVQYIYNGTTTAPDERPRFPLSVDWMRWLRDCFVHPPGFDRVIDQIEGDGGTVFVAGPPGSGRHATAAMFLGHQRGTASGCVEVVMDGDSALDRSLIDAADGILVDLSARDPAELPDLRGELARLRDHIAGRCRLGVVLPQGYNRYLPPEFRSLVVDIDRPDPYAVLERHLTVWGVAVPADGLDAAELAERLRSGSVARAAELAWLITTAGGDLSFRERVTAALARSRGLDDEVTASMSEATDGLSRLLYLSALMTEGTTTDVLVDAQHRLRSGLGHPDPVPHALAESDLSDLLGKVPGFTLSTMSFGDQRLAAAARAHFWRFNPGLRQVLRTWMVGLVEDHSIESRHRLVILDHFVRQILSGGRFDDISFLIDHWTDEKAWRSRRDLALHVIRQTLLDSGHGTRCRQEFYRWSVRPDVSVPRAEIVAVLSVEVIAKAYPEQAVTRLRHLTRHRDGGVRELATRGLMELVGGGGELARRVIQRLNVTWREATETDVATFLAVASPEQLVSVDTGNRALLDHPDVRSALVGGWRLALTTMTWEALDESLFPWFDVAASRGDVVGLLVEAAGGQVPVLAVLHGACRRWLIRTRDTRGIDTGADRVAVLLRDRVLRSLDGVVGQGDG